MTEQEKFWREFGDFLRESRENLKLSQEGAARRVNLTRQQWNRLENGKSGTKRETVLLIAESMGLDKKEALNKAGYDIPSEKIPKLPDFLYKIDWQKFNPVELMEIEAFIKFKLGYQDTTKPAESNIANPHVLLGEETEEPFVEFTEEQVLKLIRLHGKRNP